MLRKHEERLQMNNPTTIVIFGASGDLTKRKLLPALFELARERLLPEKLNIVGFARKQKTHEQFRAEMAEGLAQFARSEPSRDAEKVTSFIQRLYYTSGSYDDEASFGNLKAFLDELDKQQGATAGGGNRLYYLSTPPSLFFPIIATLGKIGLIAAPDDPEHWTRVIIEKPFGRDLETALALDKNVLSVLDESQVYRIDHYLGKETVQNIMAFRFGNSVFEPLWNRRYVDHVQITVAEAVSVGSRGGYYDHAGAVRDMVQNHLLQLLALVSMEPPASFAPKAVHDEKVKVLNSLRPMDSVEVEQFTIRGQYAAGALAGREIPAYLSEPDVAADSRTETFVALKLRIDNWRWAGVPFYMRTGKALKKRISEISIQFRQPPLALFGHAHHDGHEAGDLMAANLLSLRVQPNESIRLQFGLKIPGSKMILQPHEMEFCYRDVFNTEPPEAYERLILDALSGDNTLFIRNDEVKAAWTYVDAILNQWKQDSTTEIHQYVPGSWGPKAADDFIARDGRKWINF